MWRLAFGLALTACIALVSCGGGESTTDLNPEGPPMVRQVFMKEKVDVGGSTRIRDGLAFGDHPQIDQEDDDREVTAAVARGNQQIRVVLDELVRGNAIEVMACADGTFSEVPVGTDPNDVADCAGPPDAIANTCTAVCICEDESAPCASDPNVGLGQPIGILDENEDGAADDFRMKEYDGDELAAVVTCDGTNIPLDPELSFFNPSGNQLIPAGPIGINGLGPALVLVPENGLRTGAKCGITFQPEVVDKDGNQICAPENGDISFDCSPGDTELIAWNVEPLQLTGNDPMDGQTDVPLTSPGSTDAIILLQFNAAIDAQAAASAVTLNDGGGAVTVDITVSADDPSIVSVTVPGGYAPDTDYTIEITTALTDVFGGALPQMETISFTTGTGTPTPDAGMPDGGMPDAMMN